MKIKTILVGWNGGIGSNWGNRVMKRSSVTAAIILLTVLFLSACGVYDAGRSTAEDSVNAGTSGMNDSRANDSGADGSGVGAGADDSGADAGTDARTGAETNGGANAGKDTTEADSLVLFSKEDAAVVPVITEYGFREAKEAGTVQELYGMLPGAAEGTWYIVTVDGVEYYYGVYCLADGDEAELFGYAIVSDAYSLANGITVGMTQDEILARYPNMAVADFEGGSLQGDGSDVREIDNLGWNFTAFPRSDMGMDSVWDYGGNDYVWSDQFDHLLIAEVDTGEADTLPRYLGLLIKDHVVAAITFYYPTAG